MPKRSNNTMNSDKQCCEHDHDHNHEHSEEEEGTGSESEESGSDSNDDSSSSGSELELDLDQNGRVGGWGGALNFSFQSFSNAVNSNSGGSQKTENTRATLDPSVYVYAMVGVWDIILLVGWILWFRIVL